MRDSTYRCRGALAAAALLLAACGEPIVPRSPEALYTLARKQLVNGQFTPAVDTLARVAREAPESEPGRRARLLHIALLGGLARGYQQMGESYLAGSKAAGAAEARRMRSVAMDYFGRARGRSTEMVEALDSLAQESSPGPLRVDSAPPVEEGETAALARVRGGEALEDKERLQVERAAVMQGLAQVLAGFGGAGGELAPAAFYLGAARELVAASSIYGPEALGDRGLHRLYHERALELAERAGQSAAGPLREESERLQNHCREVLKKK